MTIVVGIACVCGIFAGFRWRTAVHPPMAWGVAILFAALQLLAMRISLIPYIATH